MASKKPMTIGLLGTGKASVKTASALISDLTEGTGEITFVVPVTKSHFTSDIESILEWAHDEGHKYVAVLDDTSADEKELADYIEAAKDTFKVAKPAVKVVNLLERAEDGRLLMLWDDEDDECMAALERAVDREVPALDLTNGLDVLQFDDPAPSAEEGEVAKPSMSKDDDEDDGTPERTVEAGDDPAAEFAPADDLDTLGVRKLRDMAEEELGLTRRKVGQMSKPDCIAALREARGGTKAAAPVKAEDEAGDEAQTASQPRSSGGGAVGASRPVEEDEEQVERDLPVTEAVVKDVRIDPLWARQFALEQAVKAGEDIASTMKRAKDYAAFLLG